MKINLAQCVRYADILQTAKLSVRLNSLLPIRCPWFLTKNILKKKKHLPPVPLVSSYLPLKGSFELHPPFKPTQKYTERNKVIEKSEVMNESNFQTSMKDRNTCLDPSHNFVFLTKLRFLRHINRCLVLWWAADWYIRGLIIGN